MGTHESLVDVIGEDEFLGQTTKWIAPDDPEATSTDRRDGQSDTRRLVFDHEETAALASVAY